MISKQVDDAITAGGWFLNHGAYVMVDGQYGSTGKGVLASVFAMSSVARYVSAVVSNAGPNSGHTSYVGDTKIVLKQLPTFSVVHDMVPKRSLSVWPSTFLSAGAVIDPAILEEEYDKYRPNLYVSQYAAVINDSHVEQDVSNVEGIASTGQGVGPALMAKLSRKDGAVYGTARRWSTPRWLMDLRSDICFFEVSQGYSLGINSGFYPHVTTRECTVSQALSDAGCPPTFFRKSAMSVRTYPIRVGSTQNSSGPHYDDQTETTWENIGREPEYTTVTKRVRRVFTWSNQQFADATWANAPSLIFLSHCDYLQKSEVGRFVKDNVLATYHRAMRSQPETVLLGFGPKASDVVVWNPKEWD